MSAYQFKCGRRAAITFIDRCHSHFRCHFTLWFPTAPQHLAPAPQVLQVSNRALDIEFNSTALLQYTISFSYSHLLSLLAIPSILPSKPRDPTSTDFHQCLDLHSQRPDVLHTPLEPTGLREFYPFSEGVNSVSCW